MDNIDLLSLDIEISLTYSIITCLNLCIHIFGELCACLTLNMCKRLKLSLPFLKLLRFPIEQVSLHKDTYVDKTTIHNTKKKESIFEANHCQTKQ